MPGADAEAGRLIEEWGPQEFDAQLRERDRVLVLFYASWCPFSRIFLPSFEQAEPEASVPFARADLRDPKDPRWAQHRIRAVPTLVYFEHGEELERIDGVPHRGLGPRALEEMLEMIDDIQEEPVLPRRMHGPRRR